MGNIDVNKFVNDIAKKYSKKYGYEFEDLRQELFLEYNRITKGQPYLNALHRGAFNEEAYMHRSLANKCTYLAKKKFKIESNEVSMFSHNDDERDVGYYMDSAMAERNILDAIDSLDADSRRYVVALGYLKADLTFLEKAFDDISAECSNDDIRKLKEKPTDENISLYIMNCTPRRVKYIREKLRNNKTFLEILKNR